MKLITCLRFVKFSKFSVMNFINKIINCVSFWISIFYMLKIIFSATYTNAEKSPVILLMKSNSEYDFPKCVRENDANQKLEYYLPHENTLIAQYFCPANPQNILLYRTDGKPELCVYDPKPVIRSDVGMANRTNCNDQNKYVLYSYGYYICDCNECEPNEIVQFDEWIEIYSLCMDKETKKLAYLHYRFSPPTLLTNELLEHERQYTENSLDTDSFGIPFLQQAILGITGFPAMQYIPIVNEVLLASPDSMAFANWKKPFYHVFNHGTLANPYLSEQWRKIDEVLINIALHQGWGELQIKTGVLDRWYDNFFLTWWKLVITQDGSRAVAIILHNIYSIESLPKNKLRCDTKCEDVIGFKDLVLQPTSPLLFCCKPNVITSEIGIAPYQEFTLNATEMKPPRVNC